MKIKKKKVTGIRHPRVIVIPAKAGIHQGEAGMDPRVRFLATLKEKSSQG